MSGEAPTPAGLLVIDKPGGCTSMDVCAIVRAKLRRAGAPKRIKVGHGGTLDPAATGVLVVLIGKATRLCERVMAGTKTYEAEIDFASVSTTDDAEGVLTPVEAARTPTQDELRAAAARFVGVIQQRPPPYSAISVGGRRAYQIAREGGQVVLPPRPVAVHELAVLSYDWPRARVRVVCGKGTYIRSLARDLGAALGTGGMLTALRRTAVGEFSIDRARPLAALPEVLRQEHLLPLPVENGA